MKITLIFFIGIFSLNLGFSQPKAHLPPEKIKILSWNIYMLPAVVNIKGKVKRAQAIGKILKNSDYDVIIFQEAFHRGARKKILSQLKQEFPYQAGPANRKLISYKTNSGLWIFSKHPIVSTKSIIFKNRSGVDAFSRKGGLIAEIMINNSLVQVAGTHLQNSGHASVRLGQCGEFYNRLLVPFYKEGVPQIICGDFNINKERHEEYNFMLQTLHATDGELNGEVRYSYDRLHNDLKVEPGQSKDLIDYILIGYQPNQLASVSRQIKIIRQNWDDAHHDLSDHYALEADIKFSNLMGLTSSAKTVK